MSKPLTWIVAKAQDGTPEIFVYGDIDGELAAEFAKELKALEQIGVAKANLRVNSEGGNVYDGLSMFNNIRNSSIEIDAYIDGFCASMASAIVMACRKVYMNKYSRLMTHKPSGGAWGTAEELRAVAKECEALEVILADMYAAKTGKTVEEVKERFLNGTDAFFSADEAKAEGLVDDVFDGLAVKVAKTAKPKDVYTAFATKLVAMASNREHLKSNNNMKVEVSPAVWAKITEGLGISDSANDSAITAALTKVVEKANMYEAAKASLDTLKAQVEADKKAANAARIAKTLDAAVAAGKLTVAAKAQLAQDYADKADALEAFVATLPSYSPITGKLGLGDVPAKYADKSWDQLMEASLIGELKANHPDYYAAIFEKTFGKKPSGV